MEFGKPWPHTDHTHTHQAHGSEHANEVTSFCCDFHDHSKTSPHTQPITHSYMCQKGLSHSRCYELYELSAGPQGLAPVLAVNAKVNAKVKAKVNAKGLHFCCVLLRMQILVGSSVTEPAYPLPELFATPSSLLRPCCVLLRIQILVVLGHSLYSLYSQPHSLPNLPKFQLPEAVSEVYLLFSYVSKSLPHSRMKCS